MGITPHDDAVLDVGLALTKLGDVHADIDTAYAGKHSFKQRHVLAKAPDLLLSAFIPTQAIFTDKRVAFPNPDWREPDLVVKRDGRMYVLDVYDGNDNFTSVARKIETAIANASVDKIVGIAVVSKENGKPYKGKAAQLARLRKTFHTLFGSPDPSFGEDDCRTYLSPLFAHPAIRGVYGAVQWDRVLDVEIGTPSWEKDLFAHAEAALKSGSPLAGP